ncbi:MAG: UvrD-helicase domain-containing protein [Chlamydiota bacterium]
MSELNIEQKQAAHHVEGPMLVLAGAGSGKTRIVVSRILYLLQIGVPASEILAMTFTNKAADEMKQRVLKTAKALILTSTFHSLCARILRESISALGYSKDFLIADEDDSEKILKQAFSSLGIKDDKDLFKNTKKQISQAKSQLLFSNSLPTELSALQDVYARYQALLQQYNTLDFDDLLLLTVKLFQDFPDILRTYQDRWRFILIDEYQDTNHAQYLLIKLLSNTHHNVFAVGDPDQSIYSWRGANIQNILRFEQDYAGAKIVRLEQNYRSSHTILETANALIKHNENRYEKNLWCERGPGEKVHLFIAENERQEADFVMRWLHHFHKKKGLPYKECSIFYRTNFQSRTFEDALLKEKIPYTIIGGLSFYHRKEIKDILAFLRMILSNCDFLAFTRTINLPKRGIGFVALEKLQILMQENQIDILTLCQRILERTIETKFSQKQLQGVEEYVRNILALRVMQKEGKPLSELISSAIERFRYKEYLKEDPETCEEKKGNIDELIAKATEWQEEALTPTLSAFLEELSLKSSSDNSETAVDSVKLMTLHNGKGLEFPVVFLVGMEEDLFPHINTKDSHLGLEEERRLCYVGITRAQDHLFLTAARYRFLWGYPRNMKPSRFLRELPSEHVHILSHQKENVREDFPIDTTDALFQTGDTVFHKDFGSGIVHKAYQTSLGTTYDVFFIKTKTTRSLAAKYAKLQKDVITKL